MERISLTAHTRRLAAEDAALARLEQACARRQNAFLQASGHWGGSISGPTNPAFYELEVAEAEVREAQAEVDRLIVRIGRREIP